ncbi:unnamed protein product [Bursaphelenchus xylophilus]|uniref:(pine wood nematode) hypothetical protein n=1 Tax=Bursaphelenchus xylophilus TaxID=6326 RepID=A0A7I8WM97_BURXY|nr:unnamed protein product [Bursaphelenchus xylophilus]CAG9104731.1 unnamed protein product [Bursaphelenchus xylophilus]
MERQYLTDQKPEFIKRAMRCKCPTVMMVVMTCSASTQSTRPFLPIVDLDQRKKRPFYGVKSDVVKVCYDCNLT